MLDKCRRLRQVRFTATSSNWGISPIVTLGVSLVAIRSLERKQRLMASETGPATGQIVTRFAPSPTGFLHIGGARTALFHWLFARHHGGKVLLRIEDTELKRSTTEAIDAILDGLDLPGPGFDEAPGFPGRGAGSEERRVG